MLTIDLVSVEKKLVVYPSNPLQVLPRTVRIIHLQGKNDFQTMQPNSSLHAPLTPGLADPLAGIQADNLRTPQSSNLRPPELISSCRSRERRPRVKAALMLQ